MNSRSPLVRTEVPADIADITDVIEAAFLGKPYAEGDEAALVVTLRHLGELPVSLVAEVEGRVVGHIAFSRALCADGTSDWYALGPIAVLPAYQKNGIGSALMQAGLEEIAAMGACGCILVGHPQLYLKFGFRHAPTNSPVDEPPEFFMLKPFRDHVPSGPIHFHPAFKNAA